MTDPEMVEALIAVFAAGLGLLAIIWGGKTVYSLLMNGRHE